MNQTKLLIAVIIILTLSSSACNKTKDELIVSFERALKNLTFKDTNSIKKKDLIAYIVIPNAGCPGCISSAEEFMIKNLSKYRNVKYILTAFPSVKNIRIKLGSNVINHHDVIIDKDRIIGKSGIVSLYPIIFYLEKGIVNEYIIADTDNPFVFQVLSARLKESQNYQRISK